MSDENNRISDRPTEQQEGISISEAAQRLGTSQVTVRNWIKTGVLDTVRQGKRVDRASLENVKKNVCGTSRLVSRANKLGKRETANSATNERPEVALAQSVTTNEKPTISLATAYEQSLTEAYRNKEGVYYTPEGIAGDMLRSVQNPAEKTLLEPCCGTGNFVIEAIKSGFKPENIYALDVDPQAVEITKQRVFEMTGYRSENIFCADFLQYATTTMRRFDFVFTNPPWGKKIQRKYRNQLAVVYNLGNSTDSCSLFFAASLRLLQPKGMLGFLLPESFFNIGAFEMARRLALSQQIERIIDYGKPFRRLMTTAHALILTKTENANDEANVECTYNGKTFLRRQSSFLLMPRNILNFWATQEEADIVTHLYRQPHYTLQGNARWAMGIVTGNNKRHCTTQRTENQVTIFRGKDIHPDHLDDSHLYIDRQLRQCQQVAPMEMYNAKEKLIYRFISDKLVFYLDQHQSYILNSANLLILNPDFPFTHRQVADLLNSRLMNWLFRTVFNTHKVLRTDLESLPLLMAAFQGNETLNESQLLDQLEIESHNQTYRFKI